MKNAFILMLAFLITGLMLPAQAMEAQMKTKIVTLYDNVGFIAKEAELNTQKGNQTIEFFVPKQTDNESIVIIDSGASIKQFRISEEWEKETILQKMVQANKGKQIIIITEFFKIKGTINEIYQNQYLEISEPKLVDSNIAISAQQSLLVPVDSIKAMSLAGKASIQTEDELTQKKVSVIENALNENRTIKTLYFVSGASWNPNYQIFLDSETKATLYYWAKVSNNTDENWNSVQLQVVAGKPNMKYSQIYGSYRLNTMYEKESDAKGGAMPSVAQDQFVSSEEQEYHVYALQDGISVEKQNEALVPILSKTIDFEKEYEWRAGNDQVKYNIRFLNKTGEPLAAGFASAYSSNMYVGGNYIKWTAEDDNASIYLAPALDIIAKKTTDTREENTPSVTTNYYTVKLHLENHKSTSAKLKLFDFLPKDAEQFKSNIAPDSIGENNEQSSCDYYYCGNSGDRKVSWTINLKTGEKKDITYSYETKYYKRY